MSYRMEKALIAIVAVLLTAALVVGCFFWGYSFAKSHPNFEEWAAYINVNEQMVVIQTDTDHEWYLPIDSWEWEVLNDGDTEY